MAADDLAPYVTMASAALTWSSWNILVSTPEGLKPGVKWFNNGAAVLLQDYILSSYLEMLWQIEYAMEYTFTGLEVFMKGMQSWVNIQSASKSCWPFLMMAFVQSQSPIDEDILHDYTVHSWYITVFFFKEFRKDLPKVVLKGEVFCEFIVWTKFDFFLLCCVQYHVLFDYNMSKESIQSSAVIMWSNITWYFIHRCSDWGSI